MRHAVRAILLHEHHRMLLCRMTVQPPGTVVWAAPGGGVEDGESLTGRLAALIDGASPTKTVLLGV
ncbi:MAG TPA: NUDIX hydrolase [Pseudonocardiaceae bacterium]|jgi:ADP-ribose pyrophosphatase YjhB (NUDIX family)|nr:NUDIX hydrolase [Pseudonocardiaceae bacterium]